MAIGQHRQPCSPRHCHFMPRIYIDIAFRVSVPSRPSAPWLPPKHLYSCRPDSRHLCLLLRARGALRSQLRDRGGRRHARGRTNRLLLRPIQDRPPTLLVGAQLLQASSPTILLGSGMHRWVHSKKKLVFASISSTGFSGWQRSYGCFCFASRLEHHESIHLYESILQVCTFYKGTHGPIQTKRPLSKRPESHAGL